ncbi:hypothetical protein LguiB_027412 [Lonicera macranthoides]
MCISLTPVGGVGVPCICKCACLAWSIGEWESSEGYGAIMLYGPQAIKALSGAIGLLKHDTHGRVHGDPEMGAQAVSWASTALQMVQGQLYTTWPPPSLIKSPSSTSFPLIIKCHAATPSAFRISPSSALSLPENPNATPPPPPPPSLTCAFQCPHFESCSGCTKEFNLHRPLILAQVTSFFNKVGIFDFKFDSSPSGYGLAPSGWC